MSRLLRGKKEKVLGRHKELSSLQTSFLTLILPYSAQLHFYVAVQTSRRVKHFISIFGKDDHFPACFIIHKNLLFPKYICSSKSMEVA